MSITLPGEGRPFAYGAHVGAARPAAGPPDPAAMAAVYGRHDSELLPRE